MANLKTGGSRHSKPEVVTAAGSRRKGQSPNSPTKSRTKVTS
jgi:hypothetical protein